MARAVEETSPATVPTARVAAAPMVRRAAAAGLYCGAGSDGPLLKESSL